MKRWIDKFTKACHTEIRRVSALTLAIAILFFSVPVSQSENRIPSDKHVAAGAGKLADSPSGREQDVTGNSGQNSTGSTEQDSTEQGSTESTEQNSAEQGSTEDTKQDNSGQDNDTGTGQDTTNQYKVTYNKNAPAGAAVTGVVEDAASPYQKDSEVTVLANGALGDSRNKGFNCNGYSFESWNTKADGSGTTYRPGDNFTITEDVVLYAQWQVMITINGFDVSPSRITISQGANYSFTVVVRGTGNLTKEATWEVVGQNMPGTTIDETGTLHVDREETAGTITVRATSKDLPDRWATSTVTIQELVRYDISYNGTGGIGDMTSHSARYIEGTRVTIAECEYNRPGYDFVSWNTAVNGNGYTVKPGDEYEMTGDVIMYAQWQRNIHYVEPEPEPVEPEPIVEPEKTDKEYAEETIALIEAIGEVTAQSLPLLERARQSYNALTDAQKQLVGETELLKLSLREQLFREQFGVSGGTGITPESPANQNLPNTVTTQSRKPLAKGKKFNAGGFRYKVTVSSLKSGTVTVVAPVKSKLKTATVPAKVTYNDVTYKVTAISNHAFQKCKKLTKVTIGKNVTSLGKNLFPKNRKCKTVIIKSGKIKKISTDAFKDLSKKASIEMPDKKYRSYESLLEKSKLRSDIRLKTY